MQRHPIAHPEADVPEREDVPVDIGTGSAAVGVEDRQAVPWRPVPAAPGQAEELMPVLDEAVERPAAVRDGGHLEQVFPAVPEPVPQGEGMPVRLAVDHNPFCAGPGLGQVRRHVHRHHRLGRARRQYAGAGGGGQAVKEVERVQVDGAQRHGHGAPLRLAGGGGMRPQENERAGKDQAPAQAQDAAGRTAWTGAPARLESHRGGGGFRNQETLATGGYGARARPDRPDHSSGAVLLAPKPPEMRAAGRWASNVPATEPGLPSVLPLPKNAPSQDPVPVL